MSDKKEMLVNVAKVFDATESAILGLKEDSRILMTDLSAAVSLAVAMEPKDVTEFVRYFVRNTNLVFVTRGKNGGVIKGTKPVKVVKEPKKNPTKDSTETV
jgi:hypothetical protein